MEQNPDVGQHISDLLDEGKYKEALAVPNDEKYATSFKDNFWDLTSIIVDKIADDTIVIKPSLHGACEELLAIIVHIATPEEALLEFIEQVEIAKNDAQFSIILTPLQLLLKKLSAKRGSCLEWSLNSISNYIETIPMPDFKLEGKECLLMDCDANIRRLTRVYSLLPPFYAPFIEELTTAPNVKTKQILGAFLISLLGKPLIYIDVDPDSSTKSEARQCYQVILTDICNLEHNILKFFTFVETCYKLKSKVLTSTNNDDVAISPYDYNDKINLTTLSGLYYGVFSGHFSIPEFAVPQVHSTEYIVHTVMLTIIHLFSFREYSPLKKGIAMCKTILSRLHKNVSQSLLSSSLHYDLCKSLVNIAIYSTYESIRKDAVQLIGIHINKFEYKGRCMLIKYIIESCNHSGMIGYAITLYKNSINESFNDSEVQECFTGAQLTSMIKKICFLPHGIESDIVELADQIISSLNFLRFLSLKDTENITGIKDYYPLIETDYLDKLRTGINMSKAHYELKLKDLEKGKGLTDSNTNISISVGTENLDKIPFENQKDIINSALNALHLIEGLIARLSECMNFK